MSNDAPLHTNHNEATNSSGVDGSPGSSVGCEHSGEGDALLSGVRDAWRKRRTPFPDGGVGPVTFRDRVKQAYASPRVRYVYWWALLAASLLLLWSAATWDTRSTVVMVADGLITAAFAAEVAVRAYGAGPACWSREIVADALVCVLCIAVYSFALARLAADGGDDDDDASFESALLCLRYGAQVLRVAVLWARQRAAAQRDEAAGTLQINIGRVAADVPRRSSMSYQLLKSGRSVSPPSMGGPSLAASPQWAQWTEWSALRPSGREAELLLPHSPQGQRRTVQHRAALSPPVSPPMSPLRLPKGIHAFVP